MSGKRLTPVQEAALGQLLKGVTDPKQRREIRESYERRLSRKNKYVETKIKQKVG